MWAIWAAIWAPSGQTMWGPSGLSGLDAGPRLPIWGPSVFCTSVNGWVPDGLSGLCMVFIRVNLLGPIWAIWAGRGPIWGPSGVHQGNLGWTWLHIRTIWAIWARHGTHLGPIWAIWARHGTHLGPIWVPYGQYGLDMGFIWEPSGQYGLDMELTWEPNLVLCRDNAERFPHWKP